MEAAEANELIEHAVSVLGEGMAALSAQDSLILRLRFKHSMSIADIARRLSLDPKVLYRRVAGLLCELHERLETMGIARSGVLEALGRSPDGREHRELWGSSACAEPGPLKIRPFTVEAAQ